MRPESSTHPDPLRSDTVRALIVDDERSLADLISMALGYEGWETRVAENGIDALRLAREMQPDVIVLDVMMPTLDGFAVLKHLRAAGDTVPVLFLTARDAVADRVAGLVGGGDDYVTKPFSLDEVVARLRALVRRSSTKLAPEVQAVLRVGDLELDLDRAKVRRGAEIIPLTVTELAVLRVLMERPRSVVSKADIYAEVWSGELAPTSTVVELYISYLRRKIDAGRSPMIRTVRGIGYIIRSAPGVEAADPNGDSTEHAVSDPSAAS